MYISALCKLLALSFLAVFVSSSEIIVKKGISEGPLNEAAVVGDTIVLRCESDGPVPDVRIHWFEFAHSPFGSIVSENTFIVSSHPQSDRYRIIQTRPNQFDLEISNVRLSDGGSYLCGDSNDGSPNQYFGQAELVVLESDPVCTTTVPETGEIIEGQGHRAECVVSFNGKLIPQMFWYGPEPFSQETFSSENRVWSIMYFTASRLHFQQKFHCITNFTEIENQPPELASNAPSYEHQYRMALLTVSWPPTNVSISPIQTSYNIGDTVTCWVDAFPEADYQWTNMRTFIPLEPGPTFDVTVDMAGFSQIMRCNVKNTILGNENSQDAFVNVLVPASTVSTMSTSSVPTTQPPESAPCDDVTGRWQSTNPTATLCIFVRPQGRVYGIVRNATDPYFVEIQGLTQPGDHSHVGFGAMWPVNALVSGFVGECHKCRGVEVLLMNGFWRKKSDSQTCGVSAGVNHANIYIFTRSGPPCGSLMNETFRVHRPSYISQMLGIKLKED